MSLFNPSGIFPLLVASCISSISSFLTAPYTSWFPVVTLAILAIIAVLSVIYALSPFIGKVSQIRGWVKIKVYELLLAIVLILIFASIATTLCSFNPEPIYQSVGLVSSQCTTTAVNLYSLALCNLSQFNTYVLNFNTYAFYTIVAFTIEPSYNFNFQLPKITTPPAGNAEVSASIGPFTLSPFPSGNQFFSFSSGGGGNFFGLIIPAIYTFILLNQIQLILIAASPLFFGIFMAIGLISRAFGATRTFGGAMIAFGLGIGFIYPLLVSLTYGFLDYAIEHVMTLFGAGTAALIGAASPIGGIVTAGLGNLLVSEATGIGLSGFTSTLLKVAGPLLIYTGLISGYFSGSPILTGIPEALIMYAGLIFIGVIFVNVLNFLIVDVFISDFSKSIGERMDFLSIFTELI